ncbi:MAG: hypothetical protein JKY48_04870 [Flavobacteriales bacterium]|nr:hypothetical protein [Flavobacteriales bacterium]
MTKLIEKNADSDSPVDRLVIPPFKSPISKVDIVDILVSYGLGTPRNLIAEDFHISAKKVSAVINDLTIIPNEWHEIVTEKCSLV